jgi:hypothetical protein
MYAAVVAVQIVLLDWKVFPAAPQTAHLVPSMTALLELASSVPATWCPTPTPPAAQHLLQQVSSTTGTACDLSRLLICLYCGLLCQQWAGQHPLSADTGIRNRRVLSGGHEGLGLRGQCWLHLVFVICMQQAACRVTVQQVHMLMNKYR